MKFLIINGPNINMLGIREKNIYGEESYPSLLKLVEDTCAKLGIQCECFQSNHEGDIVDAIQNAYSRMDGIVINPAAYTHTSIAILDALKAVGLPTVEVHLSDIHNREIFRQHSYISPACIATICGHGFSGYQEALSLLKQQSSSR